VPKEEQVNSTVLDAVRHSIVVAASPERAFEVFTAELGTWWPLEKFARLDGPKTAMIEPRKGGRVFERSTSGEEASWGAVLEWEPPHRLVLAWKTNDDPNPPTEVEVRFTADGDGTRVDLEHRGWERLGEDGAEARESYDNGWPLVLGRFEQPFN
jgi:uncharacterized protein YndB with AHSA1/START domain